LPLLFWRWVSQTICPIWPQTLILPISVSQVARITYVSHQHSALLLPTGQELVCGTIQEQLVEHSTGPTATAGSEAIGNCTISLLHCLC
jgi:hypothetical protein